jgi:steroid delta-isomerase-like uncharacterized protein
VVTDENLRIVRRFFDELWNDGQLATATALLGPDHVHHVSGEDLRGPGEVLELVTSLRHAFPDLHFAIEDEVSSGDKVVIRWTATGTHRADLGGVVATHRAVTWTGIDIVRLEGGRIVELWGNNDAMGLFDQLTS